MALTSPGVQVSVIDESFYTPAEPGTVPMIFVASAENKLNGAGTGTAAGTLKANAGKPYLLTSQRDLTETFGDPKFITDSNNNPVHAGELNEYGLQAAYSMLGVSNRAYIVRADIDLNELNASATAPAAAPADGTSWFDTQTSTFGIFEWNSNVATTTGGQTFSNKVPTVITDITKLVGNAVSGDPKASVGQIGDYVVVATTTVNKLFYKNSSGAWVIVGSAAWKGSHATIKSSAAVASVASGVTMTINSVTVTSNATTLSSVVGVINGLSIAGVTAAVVDSQLELYNTGASTQTIVVAEGSGLAEDVKIAAGTYKIPALVTSTHTSVPQFKVGDDNRPSGSIWFKTTEPNLGARLRVKQYATGTATWTQVAAPIHATNQAALYAMDKSGGGANLAAGAVYVQTNAAEEAINLATFKIFNRAAAGATVITSSAVATQLSAQSYAFDIQETLANNVALQTAKTVSFTATGASSDADVLAGAINSAGFTNIIATVDAANKISIKHTLGGDFRITDTGGALALVGYAAYVSVNSGTPNLYAVPAGDTVNDFVASNWKVLSYTAGVDAPTALTADGTLWYNSIVDEVDMMIHNGTTWVGYLTSTSPFFAASDGDKTDPAGPQVAALAPTLQSDGTALKNGDLWISTADLENYPLVYKYNGTTLKWVLLDKADQTTEDGILFGDARYNTAGSNSAAAGAIADLLASSYLDTDAPDPALYPKGMLLWNTRRSGFNVKKFARDYVDTAADNIRNGDESMSAYYTHRWVTESANQADGSGSFGAKAQRKVVVQAMQAMINSNDAIRDDESKVFNLMASPGYPELIGEMISLNNDRGLTAFIVGDSPAKLTSDATSLNDWGSNVNLAVEDNDNGLVSRDDYLGVFYPWGFTSDNAGNNVVVPPSHMMLRTLALSDQVSYPWFAPAGTRRGGITNASATGYINSSGEFVSIALNEGQRDTLYSLSINPITFITGAGLVNFGQKTRARAASSLDRINVARLVIFLRSQLNKLAKPYIFEPNDKITRDQIKQAAESLCLELVGARGLYDYLVVCDESNNTPSRIDRNELYLDIAIEPVKAVEFIYIPLRLKNTGEIAGL